MTNMTQQPAVLVKRYDRSRLYDTVAARYVSLDELHSWRNRNIAFEIRDAETGEDVTRILLA